MSEGKKALKTIILGTNVDMYRSSIEEIDNAISIIAKELEELAELKQMEQELDCSFKDIYHALKSGCVIEFNGKEAIAHARGNKL